MGIDSIVANSLRVLRLSDLSRTCPVFLCLLPVDCGLVWRLQYYCSMNVCVALSVLKQTAVVCAGVNDDLDGSLENRAVLFHVTNIPRDRGITKDPATMEPEKCADAIFMYQC